jgi:hypothetical protein
MPEGTVADVGSALLDDLLSAAVRALDASGGGRAMCSFTKAGVAIPGVKYAEGRWASLRDVRRATPPGTGSVALAVAEARQAWLSAYERALAGGAGPDWIAYRSGGVDALDELASALTAATGSVRP